MDTRTIRLDELTLARATQLAASRHCTIEELVRSLVAEEVAIGPPIADDLAGFLADEPGLADQIMEDVYRTRESQPLRVPQNGSRDS